MDQVETQYCFLALSRKCKGRFSSNVSAMFAGNLSRNQNLITDNMRSTNRLSVKVVTVWGTG